jgi:hypothetical protein
MGILSMPGGETEQWTNIVSTKVLGNQDERSSFQALVVLLALCEPCLTQGI